MERVREVGEERGRGETDREKERERERERERASRSIVVVRLAADKHVEPVSGVCFI